MSDELPIIFLESPSANENPIYKIFTDQIDNDENQELIRLSNGAEVGQVLQMHSGGIVLFSISNKQELINVIQLLGTIKKQIKDNLVKVSGFNYINNPKVEMILKKKGCTEVLNAEINQRAFQFKINLWNRGIASTLKSNPKLRAGIQEVETKKQKGAAYEVNMGDPIDFASDCWLISKKTDLRYVMGSWIIDLLGPAPSAGAWKELTIKIEDKKLSSDEAENYWQWNPIREDMFPIICDPGAWIYLGRKPEFDWNVNKWKFIGKTPTLFFYDEELISTRFITEQTICTTSKNSQDALDKLPIIQETCDPRFKITSDDGEAEDEQNPEDSKETELKLEKGASSEEEDLDSPSKENEGSLNIDFGEQPEENSDSTNDTPIKEDDIEHLKDDIENELALNADIDEDAGLLTGESSTDAIETTMKGSIRKNENLNLSNSDINRLNKKSNTASLDDEQMNKAVKELSMFGKKQESGHMKGKIGQQKGKLSLDSNGRKKSSGDISLFDTEAKSSSANREEIDVEKELEDIRSNMEQQDDDDNLTNLLDSLEEDDGDLEGDGSKSEKVDKYMRGGLSEKEDELDYGSWKGPSGKNKKENQDPHSYDGDSEAIDGSLQGKGSKADELNDMEGKLGESEDDLGGNMAGELAELERDLGGNMEGYGSDSPIDNNLQGKSNTSKISNGPLSGRNNTLGEMRSNLGGKMSNAQKARDGGLMGKIGNSTLNSDPLRGKIEKKPPPRKKLSLIPKKGSPEAKREEEGYIRAGNKEINLNGMETGIYIKYKEKGSNLFDNEIFTSTLVDLITNKITLLLKSEDEKVKLKQKIVLAINSSYSGYEIDFEMTGKVIGIEPAEDEENIYITIKLSKFKKEDMTKLQGMFSQRQEHILNFFNAAKGIE